MIICTYLMTNQVLVCPIRSRYQPNWMIKDCNIELYLEHWWLSSFSGSLSSLSINQIWNWPFKHSQPLALFFFIIFWLRICDRWWAVGNEDWGTKKAQFTFSICDEVLTATEMLKIWEFISAICIKTVSSATAVRCYKDFSCVCMLCYCF